jgi:hypothetical protein
MPDRTAQDPDQIDAETGRTVAAAISERLRTDLRPEQSGMPVRFQILLDRLSTLDGRPDGVPSAASVSDIQARP